MFEFHGWFNILEAPYFIEDSKMKSVTTQLENYVAALEWGNGENNLYAEVRQMNGGLMLYVGGNKNHRGVIGDELDQLLEWTARIAPGSYGLLYWRDDEGDPIAGPNNFQVKVMSRGEVVTRFDPFLSPFFPVVEDFYDPG
jgi:hypothetical protein